MLPKFKIAENSLFSVLMRSSWWISFALALAVLLLARLFFYGTYFVPAASCSLPFFIIGAIGLWKQAKVPGAARVAATVEAVRAMSWRDFSARVEEAFQREGYTVARLAGPADFKLTRMGKTTLVCCKRWKAASHGIEPLRELDGRREAEDAHDALYVALDGVTDNARGFAGKHRIRLVDGLELTRLLRLPRRNGDANRTRSG
ncbi:MAG: restriction endonuclease [Candidatus Accumulibacter sp.]|nr:restriction endonuclease [Accumulibacter sp.]